VGIPPPGWPGIVCADAVEREKVRAAEATVIAVVM
jgi:hypothetical protein